MNTANGNLMILDANTPEPKVFWKGQEIPVIGVSAMNENGVAHVTLKVLEDPAFLEMKAAGIKIVRGSR
jgi:hypothetical protein